MSCDAIKGNGALIPVVSMFAVFTIAAITLLVVGILGAKGTIPMAPIGARIMIGLGAAIILGMISGICRATICRK